MNKKNKIAVALCVFVFVVFSSFTAMHKFYVSVTQIEYNQNKNRIEISSRIFIDDFEKVLNKKYGKKLHLATKKETTEAKIYIEKYLYEKLKISVNKKGQSIVFLGTEYEDDVIICYLKIDYSKKITTFEVFNSLLTEEFSDQQNIVHVAVNNSKKSMLLTANHQNEKLNY